MEKREWVARGGAPPLSKGDNPARHLVGGPLEGTKKKIIKDEVTWHTITRSLLCHLLIDYIYYQRTYIFCEVPTRD